MNPTELVGNPAAKITTHVTTLFGDRIVVFVRYPLNWSGQHIIEQLNWAKTWAVVELGHKGMLVKAIAKPHYLEHFRRENDRYVVPHKKVEFDGEIMWEVEDAIYDD